MTAELATAVFGSATTLITLLISFWNAERKRKATAKKEAAERKAANDKAISLQKEHLSAIDKKQSAEIDALKEIFDKNSKILKDMQTEINYLSEIHSSEEELKELKKEIENIASNIFTVKIVKNSELKSLLAYGLAKFNKILDNIITKEFEYNIEDLRNEIETSLKVVSQTVTIKKLGLKNPYRFVEMLKTDNIIYTENFLTKFISVQKLENGVRRKAFKEISVDFVESVISNAIILYNKELNEK